MRLSTSDRFGALPTPARSSGTCPTPASMATRDGLSRDVAAVDQDASGAGAHPGDDLRQLGLAVAGDGGDADDLPGPDLERRLAQGGHAAIVVGGDAVDREDHPAGFDLRALQRFEHRAADHQPSEVGPGHAARVDARGGHAAGPHDRDPVGDGQDLAELVADEHDAATVLGHRAQRVEQLGDLLRREDRRRLVQDQHARAVEQQLHDLDALLLADRQLPDASARVDPQPDASRRGRATSASVRLQVEPEPRPVQAEQHVLGDRLRRDEREVLVDHPDARRDGVARRAEVDVPAADAHAGPRPAGTGRRARS